MSSGITLGSTTHIKSISVRYGWAIDSISFTLSDGSSVTLGGSGGSSTQSFSLNDKEFFNGIATKYDPDHTALIHLTLTTNQARTFEVNAGGVPKSAALAASEVHKAGELTSFQFVAAVWPVEGARDGFHSVIGKVTTNIV
eukprot:TRINITY_DN8342_c0_g1_i2.p1 TRINITY_DN8342_c0_g1~~TRINITY_DN8342_c0_g1_i2.p1  ORF type:complete len:141 (-),score=25.53 TRINITY_DN8342_c0_g1_i2:63-485(-)